LKHANETSKSIATPRTARPTASPAKQTAARRSTAAPKTAKRARQSALEQAVAKQGAARRSTAKPSAVKKSTAKQTAVKRSTAKVGPAAALARLREICLALPETSEKEAWGTPTFRVRGKMFAMFNDDHHGDGRLAVWCKAPLGAQEALVEADPQHYFRPPYVGPSGWVGVHLDKGLAWDEIADILDEGWRTAAPKRLAESRPRKP
jgi:hypothetical protein